MEVKTVDERGVSMRRVAVYAATTLAFIALVNVPYFYSPLYAKAIKTLVLLIVVSMMGRLLLSALLAFRAVEDPPPVADEDLPTMSVIVPAYNEASVLPATIEACKAVDYPADKLEVVLAYEADSHDETAEICERAASEDDRFVAVERDEPGGGKAAAANFALRHSTGEIIASIDADHELAPDALRRVACRFVHNENVWSIKGRCYSKNPTDSVYSLHAAVERHINERSELYARQVIGGLTLFGGGQAFFRREVFEEIGEFDENVLVEDIDMSCRIHLQGKDIFVDPDVLTYEEQPATLSSLWSQRKRWARGWLQVSRRYLPKMFTNPNLGVRKRLDGIHTFVYTLVLPFLIAGVPFPAYDFLSAAGGAVPAYTAFVPHSRAIWTVLGLFPPAILGCVFLQDYVDDLEHHAYEYLSAITLGVFLFLQSLFYVIGFLDEWVYGRESVYVTTSRAEDELEGSVEADD